MTETTKTTEMTEMTEAGDITASPGRCCGEHDLSRRRFLAGVGGGAGALATTAMLGGASREVAFAAAPGGNALVVLSLRGGADGLSIVVPHGEPAYGRLRPSIAVPSDALLRRDAMFGLHPSLRPLLPMWDAGTFGAVHAVGLEAPNRSHFSAMEVMEDAEPGSGGRRGWINRLVGLDSGGGPADGVQLGSSLLPTSLVGPAPALGLSALSELRLPVYGDAQADEDATRRALSTTWSDSPGALGDSVRLAMRTTRTLRSLATRPVDTDRYPPGPLQAVLANTAALLRADIGTKVVTIDYGDWDMHTDVGTVQRGWMTAHLGHLAASLAEFFEDLGPALAARVTLVTISEFGRRVEENGDGGLDHGYGNCMLLLGAGVNGGRVHGGWPGLDDLAEGDLAMRQDYRSVLAEVLRTRFPGTSLPSVFPGFTPQPIGALRVG